MDEDSASSEDKPKPKPPPPSLTKSTPPPPPPSAQVQRSGPPPLKVAITPGSDENDHDPELIGTSGQDIPGADAGMPNRVIAAFLDGVIAAGLSLGVSIAMPFFLDFLGWVVAAAYLVTRDSLPFLGGQSVGKKAMGIQAVTMDGQSLAGNWNQGIIRNIPMAIPFFPLVELFVLINRQENPKPLLRLGDEWAKTKVINAPKAAGREPGDAEEEEG